MKPTSLTLCFATLLFWRSLLAGDTANPPPASSLLQEKSPPPGANSEKDACCPAKPVVPVVEKSCCKEPMASDVFTRDSLYQSDAIFTDDSGKPFALSSLHGRPVVLNMFFASCGFACPLTVTDMLAIQGRLPAELRSKAVFVLVSFDVERDTTEVLAKYRAQRGLDEQWILLRGSDDSVRELAALLGVKYKREADGAFAHSNLVTILNHEGEIVHQRTGLQGGLDEAAAALAAVLK